MAAPNGAEPEKDQRPLSPKSQFQEAAQRAHTLAADADLFRDIYQYVTGSTSSQARLEKAATDANASGQPAAARYAPSQFSPAQPSQIANGTPQYPHIQQHSTQYPDPSGPADQNHQNPQSTIRYPTPVSRPTQYWLPPQSTQLQVNHTAHNSQSNLQMHPQQTSNAPVQQGNPGPMTSYRPTPQMASNTTLLQPAPARPFSYHPQYTPAPSATPNTATPPSASPSTSNFPSNTPASSAPGGTPLSNLAQKQWSARKITKVADIEDPPICHICFHMVVQKSSIKNHLVNVHEWSKDAVKDIDIYTRSELVAAGYALPKNVMPFNITSNLDASNNRPASNIPAKRKYGPVSTAPPGRPVQPAAAAPSKPVTNNIVAAQTNVNGNIGGTARTTSTLRRYALSPNPPGLPPGLVAPGKSPNPTTTSLAASNPSAAIGGVFLGVNTTAAQPVKSNGTPPDNVDPVSVSKDTSKPAENQTGSIVPIKGALEAPKLQGAQSHPTELTTVIRPVNGPTPNPQVDKPSTSATRSASNGNCVGNNGPSSGFQPVIVPKSMAKVTSWLNHLGGRQLPAHELQEIARAALSLIPDDLRHEYPGDGSDRMPGFLSQDLAAKGAVMKAVDYHEGTTAAASVQHELEAKKWNENSKEVEGTPSKRLKMSYGEILVPDDYVSDKRLANVDSDGAGDPAADDIEGDLSIDETPDRIVSMTPELKEPDFPDVQVWDDMDTDEEE